jgi:hypothetical protein
MQCSRHREIQVVPNVFCDGFGGGGGTVAGTLAPGSSGKLSELAGIGKLVEYWYVNK